MAGIEGTVSADVGGHVVEDSVVPLVDLNLVAVNPGEPLKGFYAWK